LEKYNDIVVGSGISGLTMALFLGLNGHKVLLIEKNPRIGGSLTRFFKQGVPFDKGFHFTGDFNKNGVLHDMLTALGIIDYIQPIYLSHEKANCFMFESEQKLFEIPSGISNLRKKLKGYFPDEYFAIDRYFDMVQKVCAQTVSIDLRKISQSPDVLDEDFISLDDVLNKLTDNRLLKGLLSAYSMLYGVKPSEISFANHSSACFNLYESIARVKGGGEAFIKAFREKFSKLDIQILSNSYITDFIDIHNKHVGRFVLNTGKEVTSDRCIFTMHPKEILKILPQKYLSKAFVNRISAFESSAGFFSVGGIWDTGDSFDNFKPTMVSLCPSTDINRLLDPGYTGTPPLIIMKNLETVKGKSCQIINAFELSFPEHVAAWKDSKPGKRPPGYLAYKQQRISDITKRIIQFYPEYKNSFKIVDAASVLTYRDYLHSPDGSAYGIKQKIGQYNLFGKLPLRNLYVAGQSSLMPGLLGSMLSSFILGRNIIGKEKYNQFIGQRLCN